MRKRNVDATVGIRRGNMVTKSALSNYGRFRPFLLGNKPGNRVRRKVFNSRFKVWETRLLTNIRRAVSCFKVNKKDQLNYSAIGL